MNNKLYIIAEIVDVSSAKAIAGIGFLFIFGFNLTKNSAAKCWAWAAEPPFPHNKILPLSNKHPCISLIHLNIFF